MKSDVDTPLAYSGPSNIFCKKKLICKIQVHLKQLIIIQFL